MHIHGTSPNNYVGQLYAAGNDPRSVAAQRAAETRKKLRAAAQASDAAATPEESDLISHWLDTPVQALPGTYTPHPERDRDLG